MYFICLKLFNLLTFIIPIKSSQLSSNWEKTSKLLERTLKSVCNQTSNNFKVVIACHEKPKISFQRPNIEYLQVNFPPPNIEGLDSESSRKLKETDKANKILHAFEKAKTYNPSHVMVVDADDFIVNSIVSFVESQDSNEPGWYINKGYFYKEGSKFIFLSKNRFGTKCGTCVIIRTDLFEQLVVKSPFKHFKHEFPKLINGEKLKFLPFAGAIYSIANGENHYMNLNQTVSLIKKSKFGNRQKMGWLKKLTNLLEKYNEYNIRIVTKGFRKKFNFSNI